MLHPNDPDALAGDTPAAAAWADGFGIVSPDVARYVDVLRGTPDALSLAMRNVAHQDGLAIIDPDTATLVSLLARTLRPSLVVEAGTGIGSFTLQLARSVPEDCRIVSVEADPRRQEQAHAFLTRDVHDCAVELRLGDPVRALRDGELRDIDMLVLTDATLPRLALMDLLAARMQHDAMLVVPFALRGGRVADNERIWRGTHPDVDAQRTLNRSVATDPRFCDVTLLPVGDGLLLARRQRA